jgi:nitrite reductase (NO-forming)
MRTEPVKPRHRLLIATAVALVVALGALAAFALAGGFDKTKTERVSGAGTKVVRVALVDAVVGFDVTPDVVAVDRGTHLILDVVNEGNGVHDLAVDGGASRTRMLEPGESQRLDLGRVSADIQAVCTLSGHELAGMSLDIRVYER